MLVDGYNQHLRELGLRRLLPKKGDKHYHHIAYAMQSSGFGDDEGDHDDKHVMCIITTECSVIQCSHLDLKECRPECLPATDVLEEAYFGFLLGPDRMSVDLSHNGLLPVLRSIGFEHI